MYLSISLDIYAIMGVWLLWFGCYQHYAMLMSFGALISLASNHRSMIIGSLCRYMFSFNQYGQTIFCPPSHPRNNVWEFQLFHILTNMWHCLPSEFQLFWWVYGGISWWFKFLFLSGDVVPPYICTLAIGHSLFVKYLLKSIVIMSKDDPQWSMPPGISIHGLCSCPFLHWIWAGLWLALANRMLQKWCCASSRPKPSEGMAASALELSGVLSHQ